MTNQSVTVPSSGVRDQLQDLLPGVLAASSFTTCNVLSKVVFAEGGDVLTLALLSGVTSLVCITIWLRLGPRANPHPSRERRISLGLGVLFAGVIFGVFAAIEALPVPIAVLTYYIYPLLTGLAGGLLGLDRISFRGIVTIVAAFCGLALTVGAYPQQVALAGLGFALGAACCRGTILLIARARLQHADARLTTWYSLLSSTAIFLFIALAARNWAPPQTALGWTALAAVSIANPIGVLALFVSIRRIGPIRTAVMMNLDPLFSTILSVAFLGQIMTLPQVMGGAVMLAALVAFQMRR